MSKETREILEKVYLAGYHYGQAGVTGIIHHIDYENEAALDALIAEKVAEAERCEANPNTSGIKMPLQRNHIDNTEYDKGWNACWDAYWTARWKRVGELSAKLTKEMEGENA